VCSRQTSPPHVYCIRSRPRRSRPVYERRIVAPKAKCLFGVATGLHRRRGLAGLRAREVNTSVFPTNHDPANQTQRLPRPILWNASQPTPSSPVVTVNLRAASVSEPLGRAPAQRLTNAQLQHLSPLREEIRLMRSERGVAPRPLSLSHVGKNSNHKTHRSLCIYS